MSGQTLDDGLLVGANLPQHVQERIRTFGIVRQYRAGQRVYGPGDVIQSLYLVDSGRFSFSRIGRNGNRSLFTFHTTGGSFGLYPMFLGNPAIYDCEAVEAGQLTCIGHQKLCRLIDQDELIRWSIIDSLCQRLKSVSGSLQDERMLPLRQRLARRLLGLAGPDGVIEYSQSTLAEFLGVSRFSIGKALKEFENAGFIEIGYGKMMIRNEAALRKYGAQ